MPKRKSHRKKSRRGGNPIAAATQNLTAATNARVEKTKQQVTNTVAAAKAQAQHVIKKGQEAVHHAKTTAENAAARQINKAATAVRPPPPPPSVVAQHTAKDILAPVHRAIDHGAHAVRKAIAHTHTPGVSAHHVAPAAKQAHQAVKKEVHHQKLLHAAQKQHRAFVADHSTAPMAGGSRKRRKHRRKHRRTHRRKHRRTRRRRGGMPPGGAAAHQQWATTSQNPSQLGPWPTYHLDAQGNLVAGSGPVPPRTLPRKKRPKSATKRWRPTKGGRRRRTRRKSRRRRRH